MIGVTVRDDDTGESSSSFPITVNGPPPPNAPTNLVATPGVSPMRIDLTWTDNSTDETGFIVERCKGKLTRCTRYSVLPALGANATSFSDTSVAKGTSYVYRVYATNSFGNSGFSNLASATTARR
jgi:hypothetical protein